LGVLSELSKTITVSQIGKYISNKFLIPRWYLRSITSGGISCPPSLPTFNLYEVAAINITGRMNYFVLLAH